MDQKIENNSAPLPSLREAGEVFLYMNKRFRISRNVRAHWFFDHIGQEVSINELDDDSGNDSEMLVIGIIPKGGDGSEIVGNESFRVVSDTKVVYISKFYRQVYVLDLSPSVMVADDELGCVLLDKLFELLKTTLSAVTRPFIVPGSKTEFSPQIYEDFTLINSVLLTKDNVDSIINEVEAKSQALKTKLHIFSKPVIYLWAQLRRKHKSRLDSININNNELEVAEIPKNVNSRVRYKKLKLPPNLSTANRIIMSRSAFYIPKNIIDVDAKHKQTDQVDSREMGYIIPQKALLFMLRLGLTVVQTMPENTQSNVIILTDGVAAMGAPESLQDILREFRSYTVSCSFIEIKGRSVSAPCFGHVNSMDLLHFLATATFGGYIPNCKCVNFSKEDSINQIHRGLLCWSFQNALQENEHILETINVINPHFAKLCQQRTDYAVQINRVYKTTLKELLYVRLREGFTVKNVEIYDNKIQIDLCLPFRPMLFLQYGIKASWPSPGVREDIYVDLVVAGPESEIRDLKISKMTEGVYRANTMRVQMVLAVEDACRRIALADSTLIHLHGFNINPAYYSIPAALVKIPLYHYKYIKGKNGGTTRFLVPKFEASGKDPFSQFLRFWKVVCHLKQDDWQKWVHVHIERAILYCHPTGNICRLHKENLNYWDAKKKLHDFLLSLSSFCLIEEELYVVFVEKQNETPYFFMIRVEQTLPYVVLKFAFLGGICSNERRWIVKKISEKMSQLTFVPSDGNSEQKLLTIMRRPLERILILYDEIPQSDHLARWNTEKDNKEMQLRVEHERHNALARYLEGRRCTWKVPLTVSGFEDHDNLELTERITEIATNALLHRRLEEGFQVAWMKSKVVGMCRQIEIEGRLMLEQYILFQPEKKEHLDKDDVDFLNPGWLLTAEYWREPCLIRDSSKRVEHIESNQATLESSTAKTDDDLVICVYTISHLYNLCGEKKPKLGFSVLQAVCDKSENARVSTVEYPFDITVVLQHSRRLLLQLPTFDIADDEETRNTAYASAFYSELKTFSHVFLDISDDTVFAKIFTQLLLDKGDTGRVNMEQYKTNGYGTLSTQIFYQVSDDRYLSQCRIYMRNVHVNSGICVLIICPARDVLPENRKKWPMVLALADETLIIYSLIRNRPHNPVQEYVVEKTASGRTAHSFPEELGVPDEDLAEWINERDASFMRAKYRPVEMRQIVIDLQENIMERVTVAALFKCLKLGKGGLMDKDDVSYILDGICDYTSIELQSVPIAMESFCSHLNKKSLSMDVCDCTTLQAIFDNVMKANNFSPVPTDPHYFYFDPPLKKQSPSTENKGSKRVYIFPGRKRSVPPLIKRLRRNSKTRKPKLKPKSTMPSGEEEYAPITYLPACVNQVLKSVNKTVESKNLKKIKIKLLMYVLTWPTKQGKDEGEDPGDTDFTGRSKKFINKLSLTEKETVRGTIHYINRLLELENMLNSTYECAEKVGKTMVMKVSKFIENAVGSDYNDIAEKDCEQKKNKFFGSQIRQQFRALSFVMNPQQAMATLMNRLDGKVMEHCVLRRVPQTYMFYVRKTTNFEHYMNDYYSRKGESKRSKSVATHPSLSRTESEISVFSNNASETTPEPISPVVTYREGVTENFFVILSFETKQKYSGDSEIFMKLQFCERYAAEPSMSMIYNNIFTETRAVIRQINQELLLKDMFYSRHCSPFLLTKQEKGKRNNSLSGDDEEDNDLDRTMAHTAFYDFAPGYFAPPLVWECWVEVHPRLRKKTHEKFGPLHYAAVKVREAMEQHMVTNVPNTFVFKSDGEYYFYGQVYESYDQYTKAGKMYKMDFDNMKENARSKFEGGKSHGANFPSASILFVGMGVGNVPESLKTYVEEQIIKKKLNDLVLENLVAIYQKNPRAMLEKYDVEFIQPHALLASNMFYFSIPSVLKKFTTAVRHYFHQHMSYFYGEARIREYQHSGNVFRTRHFQAYPPPAIPGHPSNPNYEAQFYLTFVAKDAGIANIGIAVMEFRIVSENGVIDKLHDGVMRAESHKSLIPSYEDPKALRGWFELITTTQCEAITDLIPARRLLAPSPVADSCAYLQVIVWQVGDVRLPKLKNDLTSIVESTFVDVVMEYGIMNTDIVETVNLYPPPSSPSAITPTKTKTPLSGQKVPSGRKRESTDGSASGTVTPVPRDDSKRVNVFTYEPMARRGSNHEIGNRDDSIFSMPRTSDHFLNNFYQYAQQFLEYVQNRREHQPVDFFKFTKPLRHSVLVPKLMNTLEKKIKKMLTNQNAGLSDKVQLFQNMNRGTSDPPRYELVLPPLKDEIADDNPPNETHPRFIMLAYCDEVHKDSRRYGYEISKNPKDAPSLLIRLADMNKECKWLFLPNIEDAFVPRQTFLFISEHNNRLTLYTYNFLPQHYDELSHMVNCAITWQNAKYRLYEHILDHPMDPVLPPVPDDERTENGNNTYIKLINQNPDILIDESYPPERTDSIDVTVSVEVSQRLFRIRRSYTVPHPEPCKIQRALQIFREMRKEVKQQVVAYQSNKLLYENLKNPTCPVTEEQLDYMWGHSRRVHYVQTPVLLSPAWRRKIAQVRRGVADPPAPKQKMPTPSSIISTTRSRAGTGASGTVTRQPSLPTKTKEDDELFDPCHVKMLHDLTEEYVAYLKTLELNFLKVVDISEKSCDAHRYEMEYPQGGRIPPDVVLFRRLNHGVLLVRLNFVPPYFIMSVTMWAAPELLLRDQSLTENESKKILSELEYAKDTLVAKCHIHSFTYDFHLRMISRYLIHREYYACRPPSARNCVYEERNTFKLHKNVSPSKIWECFLEKNYEEKYRWKVLRIRITEEETDLLSRANEYMLASCAEDRNNDGYSKVCVLLRDRRRKETDGCIFLAQYMILVDQDRNKPLEEARQRDDSSKSNMGEFRSVPLPSEEQMNREVDDMMQLIQEGGMPTVEGVIGRKRRLSSGNHTPPITVKTSGDTELSSNSPTVAHGSESDLNAPVQGDPTLRHRRNAGSSEEGEIPGEKANYIQYISVAQRKLQQLLEETTNEYSESIKEAVNQANRECLREFLWCSVQTIPSQPQLPKLEPQVRLMSNYEIWNLLNSIQHDHPQHIIELLELVQREDMTMREPRLSKLVETVNCARLCRFLTYYYGPVRCRLFVSYNDKGWQGSSTKLETAPTDEEDKPRMLRHFLITDPNNTVIFLIRCERETHPEMMVLFKKEASQFDPHFAMLLDKSFDQLIASVTAFLWSDLIYRPPGKGT